jgi:hypothetical protein
MGRGQMPNSLVVVLPLNALAPILNHDVHKFKAPLAASLIICVVDAGSDTLY